MPLELHIEESGDSRKTRPLLGKGHGTEGYFAEEQKAGGNVVLGGFCTLTPRHSKSSFRFTLPS